MDTDTGTFEVYKITETVKPFESGTAVKMIMLDNLERIRKALDKSQEKDNAKR